MIETLIWAGIGVIVGVLVYWLGRDDCEKSHPLECKCTHHLDAHGETMPCSLCGCLDFDGREET